MTSLLFRCCAVLVAFVAPVRAADTKDCTLHPLALIDLIAGAPGPALVHVTIDGHELTFYLDTATPLTWIGEDVVNQLKLATTRLPMNLPAIYLGGVAIQRMMSVKGFKVDNAKFGQVDVVVNRSTPSWDPSKPAGVLGMDSLAGFDVELDVAHRKLNLFSTAHCPGKVVYWADAYQKVPMRRSQIGVYYFPMELNGRKFETLLAPGEQLTDLQTAVTRAIFHFDDSSPDVENERDTTGGVESVYRAMALTANGGALKVVNARIRLIGPRGTDCDLTNRDGAVGYGDNCLGMFPLKLGFNVLSKLRLNLSIKDKMLYFTDAEAHR